MRKLVFLLIILIVTGVSCKKDETEVTTKMTATIDGKSWSASIRITKLQNNFFVISGATALGETVLITVRGTTTGTYNFSATDLSFSCFATYTPSALEYNSFYNSTSGQVKLTKVDTSGKTISGTFEFTVAKSTTEIKTIKSGVFENLTYTESAN